jgi:glycosyltransferase involved in cell wall biosynthesis
MSDVTHRPVITVIIPVRNEAAHIGEQLEALGRQTFDGPWELIVVDHNSTDGTSDIVRDWQTRLPNLRLEHAPRARNTAGVRNRGAELASAELLAYCDGDDVVSDGWVAAMVDGLKVHDLATGPRDVIRLNRPGSFRYHPASGNRYDRGLGLGRDNKAEVAYDELGFGGFKLVSGMNFAVHRGAYLAIGGSDESVGHSEDLDFGIRFFDAGFSIGFAPLALVHRRLRESDRALFRQHFDYGIAGVLLYRRYRTRGMRRPPFGSVVREYAFLVVRAYWLFEWSRRRHWLVVAGRHAGQLRASVRYRTFFP